MNNICLVNCPNCEKDFDDRDFEQKLGFLTCPSCKTKFKPKPNISLLPSKYNVKISGELLTIKKRWACLDATPTAIMLLFMVGGPLGLILNLGARFYPDLNIFVIILAPPLILLLLVLFYNLLAAIFNYAEITADSLSLSVNLKPFPLGNKKNIPISSIRLIYSGRKFNQETIPERDIDIELNLYAVRALLNSGTIIYLSNEDSPDEARLLQQILEKHIGIEDKTIEDDFNSYEHT